MNATVTVVLAKLLSLRRTCGPTAWVVRHLALRNGSTVSPGCESVWLGHHRVVVGNDGVECLTTGRIAIVRREKQPPPRPKLRLLADGE